MLFVSFDPGPALGSEVCTHELCSSEVVAAVLVSMLCWGDDDWERALSGFLARCDSDLIVSGRDIRASGELEELLSPPTTSPGPPSLVLG